jgi:hypothetical protein
LKGVVLDESTIGQVNVRDAMVLSKGRANAFKKVVTFSQK